MCRAGSCSGVQQQAGAGGHCGSLPARSTILPTLLGLRTGRKDLTKERLLDFLSSSKYMDVLSVGVKIRAICVTKWVLASLCVRGD